MSASRQETPASAVSEPPQTTVGGDASHSLEHKHDHSASADDVADDEALYEDMDSVGDLGPSQNGAVSTIPAVDFSKMTVAERREHSRRHSRVHSRNLSVFFPRPGTEAEIEADVAKAREDFEHGVAPAAPIASTSTSTATGTSSYDSASRMHRRNGSGNRPQITVSTDSTTLSPRSASLAAFASQQQTNSKLDAPHHLSDLSPSPTKSRRGHHHRHSVAMLDSALSPISAKHKWTCNGEVYLFDLVQLGCILCDA